MNIKIVDKYPIREFTALHDDHGVTLCESQTGAFLTLRYSEDLQNLKQLLDNISVITSLKTEKDTEIS